MNPLDEIRRLYFQTSKATIDRDLARAIDLLRSMHDEDEREKAAVFMQGLADMRREFGGGRRKRPR
ncbi:MAG: hypothetical protein HOQ29_11470 [Acidobacteria bacterium]|nr:hypothetical protein [Acidobacteriota bacterium]